MQSPYLGRGKKKRNSGKEAFSWELKEYKKGATCSKECGPKINRDD